MTINVENLKEGYDTYNLSRREISYLLSSTGVKITSNSPLKNIPFVGKVSEGTDVIANLRGKGILSSDENPKMVSGLPQALEVLGDPGFTVLVQMGNWEELSAVSFFSKDSLMDQSLVSFRTNQDESFDISCFLSKEHVLALIQPYVNFESLTMYLPQRFNLSYEEYLVFLAIADAYRQVHLEALLDRKVKEEWKVSGEDIDSALYKGFTFIDTRWLISIAQLISPFPFEWETGKVRAGLDGLLRQELLEPVKDASSSLYSLSRELDIFCGTTLAIVGFATLRVDEVLDDGNRGIFYLNLLRTPTNIWLTGFNDLASGAPEVTIFCADGFFVSHAIAELFERSGKISPPESVEVKKEMGKCPSCGAEHPPETKFCSKCGKRLPEPDEKKIDIAPKLVCPKCGNSIKSGSKFCNKCGTPVTGRR